MMNKSLRVGATFTVVPGSQRLPIRSGTQCVNEGDRKGRPYANCIHS